MENKKTTELLNLIGEYSVKERNEESLSDKETDDYIEALNELVERQPFSSIFEGYYSEEEKPIVEKLSDLEENFDDFQKKIKRHKHDEKSGDVTIRI